MPSESIHEKLQRVRRPHVHIKYEVETNGAVVVTELPFVVGVISDLSGDGIEKMGLLADRKFRNIDRYNFDEVMQTMNAAVNTSVKNELTDKTSDELVVNLNFRKMDDFSPAGVAEQVPELKSLLEQREQVVELIKVLQTKGALDKEIYKVLQQVQEQADETTPDAKL